MPRLVKAIEPPPFTPEQAEWLERRFAEMRASRSRTDDVLEAIYRACVGVARAIRPDRRWDGL
jgi:hypothetical protein